MSTNEIVLSLRGPVERSIDAECLVPDRFADLTEREIPFLPVWQGRRKMELGDFFQVKGERATRLRIQGDVKRVDGIGLGMTTGEIKIEGNAGRGLGSAMTGGTIEVRGNVGDGAGAEMTGGSILIGGNAGSFLGGPGPGAARGMSGGEIVVRGSVGPEAGLQARRGLIAIGGNAAEGAGRGMIAGSVVVLGKAARGAGQWNKRGSVVVMGLVEIPATYRFACTYRPPHVALTLTYLRTRHRMLIDERYITGRYRRYSGDMAELGRGEILRWTAD